MYVKLQIWAEIVTSLWQNEILSKSKTRKQDTFMKHPASASVYLGQRNKMVNKVIIGKCFSQGMCVPTIKVTCRSDQTLQG